METDVLGPPYERHTIDLGTEHATGWFAVIMGAVVLVAATLPSFLRTDRTVSSDLR